MSAAELGGLATEANDPRYAEIDRMSVEDLAVTMNDADASVPGAVRRALGQIVPAIEATVQRMERGGRLIYVGAGTSGRIGTLDASECPPTFNTPPELVFAIMAGGPRAIVSAVEGAEDDAESGAASIDEAEVGPLDTVIGIASSGRTPFAVAAVRRARELGALTVGLSCNGGTVLSAAAEHGIEIEVGPEVLAGSTRLKSGTAQKLVLNMFSTIAMVRQGKVYGNLMVDLRSTNEKLRERAIRMVQTITGADRDTTVRALASSEYDVKVASVMIHYDEGVAAATERLAAVDRRLRSALEEKLCASSA